LAGYDQAILVRMCQGGKDLTGPSGRDRVLRLIATLADEGALSTCDEANALLRAAAMPPLFDGQPAEAHLLDCLRARPVDGRHGNLPAALTTFIGRQSELAEVQRLLAIHRLVTVVGAGGMGKTRLSLHLCADLQSRFADGVWLIELAAVTGTEQVGEAIANALGVTAAGRLPLDAVIDHLRHRQALLLIDNCEHVVDAAADAVQRLLKGCAHLRVLATSRTVLDMDGEAVWPVPAMTLADATQLFIDRAHARNPGVKLDEHAVLVGRLCRQLDGMPLAIELAASRIGAMSLVDIAARLENHLALLTSQRRGVAHRQQTLRATIDWSHDLLTDRERGLFARLVYSLADGR
jgi:predicted ATPase